MGENYKISLDDKEFLAFQFKDHDATIKQYFFTGDDSVELIVDGVHSFFNKTILHHIFGIGVLDAIAEQIDSNYRINHVYSVDDKKVAPLLEYLGKNRIPKNKRNLVLITYVSVQSLGNSPMIDIEIEIRYAFIDSVKDGFREKWLRKMHLYIPVKEAFDLVSFASQSVKKS